MLQVCLNGARTRADHPALPISPAELAVAATDAVAAGATDIHLHPKTPDGHDSMAATAVAAAVSAVRAAVPGIPVGVTTGAWMASTVDRIAHIRVWTVRPDHASAPSHAQVRGGANSVNWHEEGADEVAAALLAQGVAVHAGVFSGTTRRPGYGARRCSIGSTASSPRSSHPRMTSTGYLELSMG